MGVLCEILIIQYSARSAQLSVHKLFTSCIRRVLVSRDSVMVIGCLRLSDDSIIYRVVNPHPTSPKNLGVLRLCTDCTCQGNNFELIPTVKWKLDIPWWVILVVNFR